MAARNAGFKHNYNKIHFFKITNLKFKVKYVTIDKLNILFMLDAV